MSHFMVSAQEAQSRDLDKHKDVFATIESLKIFAFFVLSTHYVHGTICSAWHMVTDDKEEIDCNLKKVRPTSTSFVNVSWIKSP